MTFLEKREALDKFCDTFKTCENCPLQSEIFRCGHGVTFLSKYGGKFEMKNKEIHEAYEIAFPASKENEPCVLKCGEGETIFNSDPDTLITICVSGERKVSKVEIYFKED